MTARADLIAEVRELFDEGWCICRRASLGERVLEALIEAEDTAAWGVKNVETGAITRIPGWFVEDAFELVAPDGQMGQAF